MLIIPIGTNRGCSRYPYVTLALILINTFVFILELTGGDAAAINHWAFVPARPSLVTIITAAFMHAGLLHLVGNMLFLWVFGSVVEDALGPIVYGLFYLGGGLAAALLHWVVTLTLMPSEAFIPCLGASGAVAAVLALFAIRFYRHKVRIFYLFAYYLIRWGTFEAPSLWVVGLWFGWELLSGFLSLGGGAGVAHWAHIGGFVFGVVMGFALRSPQDAAQEYTIEEARTQLAAMAPRAALEQLLPIVRAHPENEEARTQLARAYEGVGDETAADEQWRILLRQRLARRERAEVVALCRQVARRSLLDGFDGRTLYDVACCFEESFQFPEAVHLLQRVWQANPDAPESELAMLRQATLMKDRVHDPNANSVLDQFLRTYPYSQYRAYAEAKRGAGA
jgi:membrane associated rhomboid family serine protease